MTVHGKKKTKRHYITYACLIYFPPSLRTLFSVFIQASPWSAIVKYTNPEKSQEDLNWALDFVLWGGVYVAMNHLGVEEVKGHSIQ